MHGWAIGSGINSGVRVVSCNVVFIFIFQAEIQFTYASALQGGGTGPENFGRG